MPIKIFSQVANFGHHPLARTLQCAELSLNFLMVLRLEIRKKEIQSVGKIVKWLGHIKVSKWLNGRRKKTGGMQKSILSG